MKIALAMLGQPRTFEFCYPSVKKHILDVYHPDVFICTDDQEYLIRKLYNPVDASFVTQDFIWKQIGDKRTKYKGWTRGPVHAEDEMSALWKCAMTGLMIRQYEASHGEYDLIIQCRFDVKIRTMPLIVEVTPKTIYEPMINAFLKAPDGQGRHVSGYSAHIGWGTSDTMKTMFEEYHHTDEIYAALGWWQGESASMWWCNHNGIYNKLIDLSCMVIRGTSRKPMSCRKNVPLSHFPEFL